MRNSSSSSSFENVFYPRARASLIFFMLLIGSQVFAQDKIRIDIVKVLEESQNLLKKGEAIPALAMVKPALSIVNLSIEEKIAVHQIIAPAAINSKEFDIAIDSLSFLSQESTLPVKNRLSYLDVIISLLRAKNDLEGLGKHARLYLDLGGSKQNIRTLYLQVLSARKQYEEIINFFKPLLISGEKNKYTETEVRIYAVAQQAVGNDAEYYSALKALVGVSPAQKDYWRELIVVLKRQDFFKSRYEIDLLRLMLDKNLFKSGNDFLHYAETALKHGYPDEARHALNAGILSNSFVSDEDVRNYNKLLEIAIKKIREDERQNEDLKHSAKPVEQAEWAEILFSQFDYAAALSFYRKALSSNVHKRINELKLHALISMVKLKIKDEAVEFLSKIKDDRSVEEIGNLWIMSIQ